MALFKGKAPKDEDQKETPKKAPQFSGLSIGKILWAGFLVIAIITLLSGYGSYLLYAERIDDNHDDQQAAIAKRAAAVIATRLDALSQQVRQTLNDEMIQHALAELPAGVLTTPATLQKRLADQLPDLIRQIVISSDTPPNDHVQPPLSYACLELPALKIPTLELHRFGTTDQHLDIAFPISDSRSLLLSFDIRMTDQWLKTIDSSNSYIELQQQIDNHAPLTFGQTGNHPSALTQGSATHTIPATHFQVAVILPKVEPLTQIERIMFFVNFGIAILFVALTLWATLATVRAVLNKDLRTLGSLMKRSSINLHHILPIKLAELRGCADEIKRHLGIDDEVAVKPETAAQEDIKNEIPPLFQPDIMVDVAPEVAEDSDPTNENK